MKNILNTLTLAMSFIFLLSFDSSFSNAEKNALKREYCLSKTSVQTSILN